MDAPPPGSSDTGSPASAGTGNEARDRAPSAATRDEPPPPLGSWPRLYALVITGLLAAILFCGWLTRLGR